MPESLPTALLLDPGYMRHETGQGHPESSDRYTAVTVALDKAGLTAKMPRVAARSATEDEVARCHSRSYIAQARKDIDSGADVLSTGDTQVCPRSYEVALQAVGGVLNAVDSVMTGKSKNAFCAVRPPGHHATFQRGMGFCVFNNIAAGARHAQQKHLAARVMIVDWDVHHGNGTQDIFYRDGSVLFFSTHQHPWYPGTGLHQEKGDGPGEGKIHNYPFPAGSGRQEILGAFQQALTKAAAAFKPDLVMISAGFDSRMGDPLGRFRLTDDDFRDLTLVMMEIAGRFAHGRLVSVLEGGYSLNGLASGVTAHVKALAGL
ncbi:MAG: histone deacetylase [Candidatus Solibacter usitatus]|nr:histone deacetylase [Candidatus Solibacter usitatus]